MPERDGLANECQSEHEAWLVAVMLNRLVKKFSCKSEINLGLEMNSFRNEGANVCKDQVKHPVIISPPYALESVFVDKDGSC